MPALGACGPVDVRARGQQRFDRLHRARVRGDHQRGTAVLVHRVHLRAGFQQELDIAHDNVVRIPYTPPLRYRPHQGRGPVVVNSIGVSASLQQDFDHFRLAVAMDIGGGERLHQRGVAPFVDRVHLRAGGQQLGHPSRVIGPCLIKKRRFAPFVDRVGIGARLQKCAQNCWSAARHQGGVAVLIGCIGIGARVQERLGDTHVVIRCHQRRGAGLVCGVGVRARGQQQIDQVQVAFSGGAH